MRLKSHSNANSDQNFYTVFQRAKHEQEMHKKETYMCKICGIILCSNKGLTKHVKIVHDSIEKTKCPFCDSEMRTRVLNKHIKRIHSGFRHHCDICGVSYSGKHSLRDHMDMHNQSYGAKTCEKCNRRCFSRRSFTWLHIIQEKLNAQLAIKFLFLKFRLTNTCDLVKSATLLIVELS